MNYVEFHLGDHVRATAHLTMLEEGAYRRLLDQYYVREQALPLPLRDVFRLVRAQSKQDREAVEVVLREFFNETPEGWAHTRCDAEIAKYHESEPDRQARKENDRERQRRARERRRVLFDKLRELGHVPPFDTKTSDLEAMLSRHGSQPVTRDVTPPVTRDNTATQPHYPIPDPIPEKEKTPPCPEQAIVELYHLELPGLPKVRLMPAARQKALRKLWSWVLSSTKADGSRRAETAVHAIEWIRTYFRRASENDFLMGRTHRSAEHANWRCDLDFLLTDRGMQHVIEKT